MTCGCYFLVTTFCRNCEQLCKYSCYNRHHLSSERETFVLNLNMNSKLETYCWCLPTYIPFVILLLRGSYLITFTPTGKIIFSNVTQCMKLGMEERRQPPGRRMLIMSGISRVVIRERTILGITQLETSYVIKTLYKLRCVCSNRETLKANRWWVRKAHLYCLLLILKFQKL